MRDGSVTDFGRKYQEAHLRVKLLHLSPTLSLYLFVLEISTKTVGRVEFTEFGQKYRKAHLHAKSATLMHYLYSFSTAKKSKHAIFPHTRPDVDRIRSKISKGISTG